MTVVFASTSGTADNAAAQSVPDASPRGSPPEPTTPVIQIEGPTVVAYWTPPVSDSALALDPDLQAALDEQQYYWAETREKLSAAGILSREQPGRQFVLENASDSRVFTAPSDSGDIGYLLVRPDLDFEVVVRLHYPDELVTLGVSFLLPGSNDGPLELILMEFKGQRSRPTLGATVGHPGVSR